MPAVDGRHDGRRIIIPVVILAPATQTGYSTVDGTALLDTGSTTSGIKRSVAQQLGLIGMGKRPLNSAGGEVQAERFIFSFGLQGSTATAPTFPFVFEEVLGFELKPSFQFDALIGMDIFRQCEFVMRRDATFSLAFGIGRT